MVEQIRSFLLVGGMPEAVSEWIEAHDYLACTHVHRDIMDTYRNDFMGLFQEVYITQNGQRLYSKRLRSELDEFLWQWLKNIHDQGFTRCL